MTYAPDTRLRALNSIPIDPEGTHVLYWMVGFRRPHWNFALQHAVAHAVALGKPLVILEALRVGYPWASERLHRFVLDGMRAHDAHFADEAVVYFPYLEPEAGHGKGLLTSIARTACVVVSDDYPTFFIPKMQNVAASRLDTRLEIVDSNGLLPVRSADKVFARAFDFRRVLQRTLLDHLNVVPEANPLATATLPVPTDSVIGEVLNGWSRATDSELAGETLHALPVDHGVGPVGLEGGFIAGEARAMSFLNGAIDRYGDERSHPDADAASGLSPWLHFGHVSPHQIFDELARNEGWSVNDVSSKRGGQREGWWGMSPSAESFLDELVTWRELGFNMTARRTDYDQYDSLPEWARKTLAEHADDPREHLYTLEQFEASETHDPIWNAAQNELRDTGRMQNYLRMLWGKKILEWTPNPQDALAVMVELNNKYALDGRDPNSYSGIFWVLGRYDRAWGPERPIFGKIRYMSSENTKRKLRIANYLARFGSQAQLF
ncbi:MAG: deoxyribodipyrimidine photolyase [Polyangiales bacterium]